MSMLTIGNKKLNRKSRALTVIVSTVFVLLEIVEELTISPSSESGKTSPSFPENWGGGGTG